MIFSCLRHQAATISFAQNSYSTKPQLLNQLEIKQSILITTLKSFSLLKGHGHSELVELGQARYFVN